ncbi:unnamed protein product [Litomosoides sigmodontis]|uniref:Uncharacterized protein n=1 Tax=Litomosoides sigmodontis TaxID=42156 RepID=A0A3P6TZ07_LITSI|nr:unnamed protein product [Litomosoides sigmodontis]
MGDAEFRVAIKKDSEENEGRKQTERAKLLQMQKDWLEARKRIASLEAQVNMHRLREEALVCEMVELRKSQEVSQNKFDEERREWLRDLRAVQECKAQNLDKGKAEVDLLKAEIAELKSCLDDAERTRLFLLEDNGKIKQQKAKLRCDYNELRREHSKLLSSQQAGTTPRKNEVLCDRSGTENIPNSNRSGLRGGNNFGSAVLGLSETCSVCISPAPAQFSKSNIMGADSKHNEDSVTRSVNTQASVVMDNVNAEGKKMIEELIQKLKHSDERNQELRKALHAVDEQCEKLVRSFQELKLRYEEKERSLAPSTSLSYVTLQGSSQSRRTDLEMGHSAVKKDHKLLSQNLIDDGDSASNAVKRKYSSCLAAFGKRSKNDLC